MEDRAVPDAVHERFQQIYVYCDHCELKFVGNDVNIKNHFKKDHESNNECTYCSGKIFHYYKVKDGNNKSERFVYHKCRDWLTDDT